MAGSALAFATGDISGIGKPNLPTFGEFGDGPVSGTSAPDSPSPDSAGMVFSGFPQASLDDTALPVPLALASATARSTPAADRVRGDRLPMKHPR
jgi:hypothetical protein